MGLSNQTVNWRMTKTKLERITNALTDKRDVHDRVRNDKGYGPHTRDIAEVEFAAYDRLVQEADDLREKLTRKEQYGDE